MAVSGMYLQIKASWYFCRYTSAATSSSFGHCSNSHRLPSGVGSTYGWALLAYASPCEITSFSSNSPLAIIASIGWAMSCRIRCGRIAHPGAIMANDCSTKAEQFVGQELLTYSDCFQEHQLYFWQREKQTSDAEVDYVITVDEQIIPLEVKAGASGHLKSLRSFMNEKKSPLGIRISQKELSLDQGVLSIPYYMINQIPRLVHWALKS